MATPKLKTKFQSAFLLLRGFIFPQIRKRPQRYIALVFAIALGVSAVVAAGTLSLSMLLGMEKSWNATTVENDFRISNGLVGVPASLINEIKNINGIDSAIPSIVRPIHWGEQKQQTMLIGLNVQNLHTQQNAMLSLDRQSISDLSQNTKFPRIAISQQLARENAIQVGETIRLHINGKSETAKVEFKLPNSPISKSYNNNFILMDLSTAQNLLSVPNHVDSIDVILDPDAKKESILNQLHEAIRYNATVSETNQTSREFKSLTRNLHVTLAAPSMMAIVVGALIIFYVIDLTMTRRRNELELLRVIGATDSQTYLSFAIEFITIITFGCLLGIALGLLLSQLVTSAIQATISSVYRPLPSYEIVLSTRYSIIASAIATFIAGCSYVQSIRASKRFRSNMRMVASKRGRRETTQAATMIGLVTLSAGLVALALQSNKPQGFILGFLATGGVALILLGILLILPGILNKGSKIPRLAWFAKAPVAFQLASTSLFSDPIRTTLAIGSIFVCCAFTFITVGSVASLTNLIKEWIEQTHSADWVVTAPGSIGIFPASQPIPGNLQEKIESLPHVKHAIPNRFLIQPYEDHWVAIVKRDPSLFGSLYPVEVTQGELTTAIRSMQSGVGTIASQHFMEQFGHEFGDTIQLRTPSGILRLQIDAVVQNFSSSDVGSLLLHPTVFTKHYQDHLASNYDIWEETAGLNATSIPKDIKKILGEDYNLETIPRDTFLERSKSVIDGIFYMAYGIEVVAVIAMLISIFSFFATNIEERILDWKSFSFLGASKEQIHSIFVSEAILVGAIGAILGILIGVPLAYHMVSVTMRIAGGFRLDFVLPNFVLLYTTLVAILLCAGIMQYQLTRLSKNLWTTQPDE